MNFPNRQNGASLAGWMILILVFGLLFTATVKLLPIYMEHNTISKVFDQLGTEEGMGSRKLKSLIAIIHKKLKINQIRKFPLAENLTMEATNRGKKLVLVYEVRVPLIQNIDLIASFDKEVELRE